ncbi:MAG: DUF2723 domain-containing protein [Candidatus Omnitrophica bacterium]|nr:DUF2723 domain-containing protein [Candidatus Omnitrophota bacterium]
MIENPKLRSAVETWLDPLLLTLLGLFYLVHLYPTLWWGDGPELLTAALKNGVAHPTGYPLYLVLVKIFSAIPLGSFSWKGNLFSMMCTLGAFAFLARLVPLTGENLTRGLGWRIGLTALAFSSLLWEPSLNAEVYTLSVLFFALSLWIGKRFLERPTLPMLLILGAVVGLGVGHHRLMAFLVPGLALWIAPAFHDSKQRSLWLLPTLGLFLIGVLAPYSILYFRAQGEPPINWGDPSNLKNLWAVFSAEQFRMDQKVFHLKRWVAYSVGAAPSPWQVSMRDLSMTPFRIWHNFGLASLMGVVGLVALAIRDVRMLLSGLVAWFLPTLFVIQYQVGDQESFHLLPYLVLGCLAAYGWAFAVETVWARSKPALIFLAALALMQTVGQIDKLQTPPDEIVYTPERYARRTLDQVPSGGALFVCSDQWDLPADFLYFPILYHHHVAERNRSAVVVAEGYFTSPWYRETLERQGVAGNFFDALENGTDEVDVYKTDFKSYIRDELPKLLDPEQRSAEQAEHRIFLVDGRPYFLNRNTMALLAAEYLFPDLLKRPFYATAKFDSIKPYLKQKIEWKPVARVPIDDRSYRPLRGEPLPSGNIFRAEIREATGPQ